MSSDPQGWLKRLLTILVATYFLVTWKETEVVRDYQYSGSSSMACILVDSEYRKTFGTKKEAMEFIDIKKESARTFDFHIFRMSEEDQRGE